MSDPKIDRAIDWRSARDKIDKDKYELEKERSTQSVESFRALRIQLGLTQAEVAEILNVTQSNVSKMESKPIPSIDILRSLVRDKGKVRLLIELDEDKIIEFDLD